ncbi:hypothetical protein BsWGS_02520 [Bradybaena similaris]
MEVSDESASHPLTNDVRKHSVTSQQKTHVIYPPCVVQSIHDVDIQDGTCDISNHSVGDAADRKAIYAEDGVKSTKDVHSEERESGCLSRLSSAIAWALETAFFKVGLFVGEYPVVVIVTVMIMCGLCGLGMTSFKETEEQEKLWVPQTSRLIPEKAWVDRMFPAETRFISVLAVQHGGSVLTPVTLNALMDFYLESLKIRVKGRSFMDMCVRVGPFCYVSCLLELWQYNETIIRSLTASDILTMVNRTLISPLSGVEVQTLLGGDLTYNEQGMLLAAEATQITWVLKKESDNLDAAEFEKSMIDKALQGHQNISGTTVYATRSFDDEGYGAVKNEVKLLSAGFILVFVFIMLSLGKFNLLEQKIYLSLAGMGCVGLAILAAYGLATSFGVMYSPIQNVMPFLLLGIGVDDMFVVIETWKNLSPEEASLDVPKKLALTLSKAGVSITVTSLTDVVAFGISATTTVPALSSFCIYATLGIFILYVLVATVFAGVLALDERRRKARRDACICCYRHSDSYKPSKCGSGKSFLQVFFGKFYGPFITKVPTKIIVILVSLSLAALGFWRFLQMKQDFDLINYIPSRSYAHTYARTKQNYFDRDGADTTIYCGGFNYFEEFDHLTEMHIKLSQSSFIQKGTTNSWITTFAAIAQQSGWNISSEAEYYSRLYSFLQTRIGQRFASFIKLNSTVEPVSIVASYFNLRHTRQPDSAHDVKSMDNIRHIIDSAGLPKFSGEDMPEYMCFAYTRAYMQFETNKVLQEELYRNLGMSAAAVFLVTLILIANLWTSLLVFICVVFTIAEVGGVLEMWGITIDTASSILLTLSVGLAVDYSAHIGHTFMTISGSRNDRVKATLSSIGPAVFNGGFSTFLAFLLLADSESYGFQLFFKVFFSVVVFGLFHGLAFLPVVLSLVGAKAYKHSDVVPSSESMVVNTSSKENHAEKQMEQPLPAGYTEPLLIYNEDGSRH